MLILHFLKHSKLKLCLCCAVVEFLFNRAVYTALLIAPLNHAWDLIWDLKMAVSLVLKRRGDILDRGDRRGDFN